MPFLAAATAASKTSGERLREIPVEFWMKLAIAILVLIIFIVLLRKVAKMNKVVVGIIVLLVLSFVGFNWIYERNEPSWATPVVQWLANYFPSKTSFDAKQKR